MANKPNIVGIQRNILAIAPGHTIEQLPLTMEVLQEAEDGSQLVQVESVIVLKEVE